MIQITRLQDKKIILFLKLNRKYFNKVQYMFELLRFGKEQEIKYATTESYDDSRIEDKEQVRDLGIIMSNARATLDKQLCVITPTFVSHD